MKLLLFGPHSWCNASAETHTNTNTLTHERSHAAFKLEFTTSPPFHRATLSCTPFPSHCHTHAGPIFHAVSMSAAAAADSFLCSSRSARIFGKRFRRFRPLPENCINASMSPPISYIDYVVVVVDISIFKRKLFG